MKSILIGHLNHSNRIRNEKGMAKIQKPIEIGKPKQGVPVHIGQKRPECKVYRYMIKVYRYTSPKMAQNVCFSPIFPCFDIQSTLHFKHTSKPFQIHLRISFLFNSSLNYISFFQKHIKIPSKTILIWVKTHTQTNYDD